MPLNYWPLPGIDFLDNYPVPDRLRYWSEAASHFDQLDWLDRSGVFLDSTGSGRPGAIDSIRISAEAARILQIHPRLRVTVPLWVMLSGSVNGGICSAL